MATSAGTAYIDIIPRLDPKAGLGALAGNLKSSLGKMGVVGGVALAAGITAAGVGKALYDIGEKYKEATNVIRKETGATGKTLAGLSQTMKDVYGRTPASLDDVAHAVSIVNARLDLQGKALEDTALAVVRFSRLTGVAMPTAVERSTKAMAALGVPVKDNAKFLDLLFVTMQKSGGSMQTISQVLERVGPSMKAAGMSTEQTVAMIGSLEKAGLPTSRVVMGLQSGFVKLAKAGKDPVKTFKDMAVAVKNAKSNTEAMTIVSQTFSARAAGPLTAALRSGKFNMEEFAKSTANAQGAMEQAGKDVSTLSGKWEVIKHKISNVFSDSGGAIYEGLNSALGWVMERMPAVIAAITPMAQQVSSSIRQAIAALTPLVQVLAQAFAFAWPMIQRVVSAVMGFVRALMSVLGPALKAIAQLLKGDFSGALRSLGQAVLNAVKNIPLALLNMAKAALQNALQIGKAIVTGVGRGLLGLAKEVVSGLGRGITAMAGKVKDAAVAAAKWGASIVSGIVSALGGLASAAGQAILDGLNAAWEWAKSKFGGPIGWVIDKVMGRALVPEQGGGIVGGEGQGAMARTGGGAPGAFGGGMATRAVSGVGRKGMQGLVAKQADIKKLMLMLAQIDKATNKALGPETIAKLKAKGQKVIDAINEGIASKQALLDTRLATLNSGVDKALGFFDRWAAKQLAAKSAEYDALTESEQKLKDIEDARAKSQRDNALTNARAAEEAARLAYEAAIAPDSGAWQEDIDAAYKAWQDAIAATATANEDITIASLRATAETERKNREDARAAAVEQRQFELDNLRASLQNQVAASQAALEAGRINAATFQQQVAGALAAVGVNFTSVADSAGLAMAQNFNQTITEMLEQAKAVYEVSQQIAEGKDAIDAIRKATAALKKRKKNKGSGQGSNARSFAIPAFATGAVVKEPTIALIGETRRAQPEIVTPERLMRKIVAEEGGAGNTEVRVFIGDQELRGIVKTEIFRNDKDIARRAMAGVR